MFATMRKPVKNAKAANNADKKLKETLDNMVPALREEIQEILAEINDAGENDIRRRIDIGTRISLLSADRTGRYGLDPATDISKVLRVAKESVNLMVKVAEAFDDAEIDKLLKLENPITRERLTWNHYVALSMAPDSKTAFEYANRTVNGGWSTKDLRKTMIAESGGPRSAGGRPPKRHSTIDGTLNDIITKVGLVQNAAAKVWLSAPPDGLNGQFDALATTPGWLPSEEFIAKLQQTKDAVEMMIINANVLVNNLSSIYIRSKSAIQAAQMRKASNA